jgi:hypothetical protein
LTLTTPARDVYFAPDMNAESTVRRAATIAIIGPAGALPI